MIKTIAVKSTHPYRIYLGEKALDHLSCFIKKSKLGQDAVIITTPRIRALHGKKILHEIHKACARVLVLTVPDSEQSKSAESAFRLIRKITKFGSKKNLFLVAFGGGVVGDLTGFIAAIYKRGVPYIQVPTTLLAQIDSSIGGKTAVDTAFGKNLVGAFYQPSLTLCDLDLLKTLPLAQTLAGLSEAVKYAIIKDRHLFSFIEKNYIDLLKLTQKELSHLILRCASIKAQVVAQDEFDKKGIRIILNFGHTIGHAIEAASKFKICHGDAVSIGMVCAVKLSKKLGLLNQKKASKIIHLIKLIGLATEIKGIKPETILKAVAFDKKAIKGTNRFVLIEGIGKTKIVENIPQDLIRDVVLEQTIKN